MPAFRAELRAEDGGRPAIAAFEKLQQDALLRIVSGNEQELIKNQQRGFLVFLEYLEFLVDSRRIGVLDEEIGEPDVKGMPAVTAGIGSDGVSQECLARSCGSEHQDIALLGDEVAGSQPVDQAAVQLALRQVGDVAYAGFRIGQPGFFQQTFDAVAGTGIIFLVDHDRHALIEGHSRELVRLFHLGYVSVGESWQPHFPELANVLILHGGHLRSRKSRA